MLYVLKLCSLTQFSDIPDMLYVLKLCSLTQFPDIPDMLYVLKLCSLTQFPDIPDMLYVLTILNTEFPSYVSNTPLRALQAFQLIYPIPTT